MNINATIRITENGKEVNNLNFANDLSGDVTFEDFSEFVRQSIISISKEALAQEQSKGYFKQPSILVDNKKKPIEEVRPFGEVLISERLTTSDLLIPIYQNILIRSPKGDTGTYQAFNIVLHNNIEIARTMEELSNWVKTNFLKKGDVVRFLNLTPYASKLERNNVIAGGGKGIRMGKSSAKGKYKGTPVRIPNGVYVLALRASKKYLKGNVFSEFQFINGKYINAIAKPKATLKANQGKVRDLRTTFSKSARNVFNKKIKGFYVYPSIKLTITEDSL